MTEELDSVTQGAPAEPHTDVQADVVDQQTNPEPGSKEYNFRELERERERAEERAERLEQQNSQLLERFARLEAQREQDKQPQRDPDDFVSNRQYEEDISQRERKLSEKLAKLEAKAEYPDLNQVIDKYGKKLSPAVKQACMRADNPWMAVYDACKNSEAYYRDTLATSQHEHAKRAETNAKKAGNPAAVGGRGNLSLAKDFSKMSDAELIRMGENFRLG